MVSTTAYLQNQAPQQPFSEAFEEADEVPYCNPTIMKATAVFFLVVGIALLATISIAQPLGTWVVPTFSIIGSLDVLICLVALRLLGFISYIIPPHHSMTHHVYEERKINCPNEHMLGELKYVNHVPILTIENAENRLAAGKTFGYLTAKQIFHLVDEFRYLLHDFGHYFGKGMPRAREVPEVIQAIKEHIPQEYLQELEGFVVGCKIWCREHGKDDKGITVDELLLYHLIPERCHFNLQTVAQGMQRVSKVGCTVLMAKDKEHGMTLGRNLDWESYGLIGTHSLVVTRKKSNGDATTDVTVPGILGTFSGMNSAGLCVAMNVVPANTFLVKGMPALFFNRYCLEHYQTVKEAQAFIESRKSDPLGPYHLTLVDPEDAYIYSLFQGIDQSHHLRRLDTEQQPYLCTTNFYYLNGEKNRDMFMSGDREWRIFNLEFRSLSFTSVRQLEP